MRFISLLKINLKENFSLKRLFGFNIKENKVKAILIGALLVYALVSVIGVYGYLFFDLGETLRNMGQLDIMLGFLGFYSVGLGSFIIFFRASGSLFYYKDFDILAPLPIHPRKVFIAKLSVLMIMVYAMSFLATAPIIVSYFYWNGFHVITFLIYFIAMIVIPLVPVIVISFISLGVALITSKLRASKIINLVLMFAIFLGFLFASFSFNSIDANPLTGQIDMFAGLKQTYPPLGWFIDAIYNHDFILLLYLVGSHTMLFGLFITFIFPLVNFTNKRGIRSNIKKNHKAIDYRSQPIIISLIKKEFSKFISITLYALNAGLGPVILVIASIASIFYKGALEDMMAQYMGAGIDIEIMLMIFYGFLISMTYTPAVSLSLEGKNIWIIKSLPIKAETIMHSKILFNVLLIVPVAVISIILIGYSMGIAFGTQLLFIGLITAFTFAISFMDATWNLLLPKMDYINDVEVIKQSASAFLGIFGGFALIALHGLIYYLFQDYLSLEVLMIVLTGFSILCTTGFYYFVKTKAESIFLTL